MIAALDAFNVFENQLAASNILFIVMTCRDAA
ncbi:MAG: hypothetical protein ACI9LE_002232, partial [Paraglaciecola sp.]